MIAMINPEMRFQFTAILFTVHFLTLFLCTDFVNFKPVVQKYKEKRYSFTMHATSTIRPDRSQQQAGARFSLLSQ